MYENKRLTYLADGARGIDGLLQTQIAAFLPAGRLGRVLDYGAGNSPYRQLLDCDRYVAADLSQNVAGSIDHLIEPGHRLPIEDGAFDVILLFDVLEHVPDPDFVLGEIRRLIAPGGRLLVSVPFLYREHETPHDIARYTAFGMRELLRRQNADVVRMAKVGNAYYTLLSLFLERGIVNGERSRLGLAGRALNRLLRALVPLLSPLLSKPPRDDDGVYHHLLLEAGFR